MSYGQINVLNCWSTCCIELYTCLDIRSVFSAFTSSINLYCSSSSGVMCSLHITYLLCLLKFSPHVVDSRMQNFCTFFIQPIDDILHCKFAHLIVAPPSTLKRPILSLFSYAFTSHVQPTQDFVPVHVCVCGCFHSGHNDMHVTFFIYVLTVSS